jgi:hypothetical protein
MATDTTSGETELEVCRWTYFSRRDLRPIPLFQAVAGIDCVELVATAMALVVAAAAAFADKMTHH